MIRFTYNKINRIVLLLLFFSFCFNSQLAGQSWIRALSGNLDGLNFFTVQKDFYKYWEEEEKQKEAKENKVGKQEENEEEGILTHFKRFERFWENRINPDGSFPRLPFIGEERNKYLAQQNAQSRLSNTNFTANWKPVLSPTAKGVGRIDCIATNPIDSNIIWAGSPTGGLWKTTNGGQTWTTNTDALPNIGIADIVIDPTNPNIMYIATGDRDSYFLNTSGVFKSTDGGNTWQATGSLFTASKIYRLLINPQNPNILYIASNFGIWKTINGGSSWSQIFHQNAMSIKDLALQPGNPNTIYAACTAGFNEGVLFYKSTDAGSSFNRVSSGLPTSGNFFNLRIATTPSDPNYLYLLLVRDGDGGFKGLYLSTNGGNSFNLQSSSPNILGYLCNPPPESGQGYYDLALSVSATNKNIVLVGGIHVWKSMDAGVSWNSLTCDSYQFHWDQHFLLQSPFNENKFYAGNDGGMFEILLNNTLFPWKDITNNMQTMQFYGFGNSQTNPNKLSGGTQDNGTHIYENNIWKKISDGDIIDVQYDYSDESIFYVLGYSGFNNSVIRYENNGATYKSLFYNNSDLVIDPVNPEIVYYYKNAFNKSIDRGDNWVKISNDNVNNNQAQKLKFAGNNKELIFYMDYPDPLTIKKFNINTGQVTSIPNSIFGRVYDFAVSPTDINNIWISCGGKIYKTINGGNNWFDISGSLTNSLAKLIVYENGSNDGIYIVTDIGIFYRNAAMSDWVPWMDGLPNVIITDLDIQYGVGKIRASSFGRGIWEADLYTAIPIAKFSSSTKNNCPGTPISFFDSSLNRPATWQWSFPGGVPSSSTIKNPSVTYSTPGTYNVQLTVSNPAGSNTVIFSDYININSSVIPEQPGMITGSNLVCQGSTQTFSVTPSAVATSYTWTLPSGWTGNSTSNSITTTIGTSNGNISVKANNACGSSSSQILPVSTYAGSPPPKPGAISGVTILCETTAATYSINAVANATSYTWTLPSGLLGKSTTNSIDTYAGSLIGGTVSVKANNGCGSSDVESLAVNIVPLVKTDDYYIHGNSIVCSGSTQIYSVNPVQNANSYTWQIPSGWTWVSFNNNSIEVIAGANSGNVIADANGTCSSIAFKTFSITVMNQPSKPSAISGNQSVCQETTQNYSVSPVNGATSYTWTLPSGWTGSSTTNSINTTVGAAGGTISVKANNSCGSSSNQNLVINVNPVLTQPGAISGNTTVCQGSSQTYSISAVSGATNYTWTLPSGWTGSSTTNSISITASASSGTISVKANNACGSSSLQNLTITVSPSLVQPGIISGNNSICQGSSQTYSIIPVAGASSYTWMLPSGWTGSSTTTSITITASALSGAISVKANNSICSSTNQSLAITVNPLPAQPGAITGSSSVCNGSSQTFSISTVSGATNYTWTLPSGWTGSSTTNSINTTVGAVGGTISVKTNNSCGNSVDQTLAVATNNALSQPGAISGNNAVCPGSSQIYSISAVNGASSYTWSLPSGWTGNSTTNSIITTVGAAGGTVSVKANNSCGSSSNQTLAVAINTTVSQPVAIIGSNSVCPFTSQTYSVATVVGATSYTWTMPSGWTGSSTTNSITTIAGSSGGSIKIKANNGCGSSIDQTLNVSINPIPNAGVTSNNSIIFSATLCQGDSILLTTGNATSYLWSNGETTQSIKVKTSGNYVASLTNSFGCTTSSQVVNVIVNPLPAKPGIISGSNSVCQNSSQNYSVPSVTGATSYTWTLPSGWTGSSTTNSITTTVGASGGTITVKANNSCGNSSSQDLSIIVNSIPQLPVPGAISGNSSVCQGSSQTYSINPVTTATSYTWTLPSGWSGSSTTNSITTTVGAAGGIIAVKANNSCGSSSNYGLSIIVNPIPEQPGAISGNASVCQSSSQTYSITPLTGATSYTWTLPSGWSGSSTTNSITTIAGTSDGIISVKTNNGCGNSVNQTMNIKVNPIVQPSISISQSSCTDSTVNFNSSIVGGGSNPTYLWTIMGAGTATSGNTDSSFKVKNATNATQVQCTLTSNAACANPASVSSNSLVVNCIATAIRDINGLEDFKIIPNPNNGIFNVRIKLNTIKEVSFRLSNSFGQIIYQSEIYHFSGTQIKEINKTKISAGVYLLETKIGKQTFVEKIIVVR